MDDVFWVFALYTSHWVEWLGSLGALGIGRRGLECEIGVGKYCSRKFLDTLKVAGSMAQCATCTIFQNFACVRSPGTVDIRVCRRDRVCCLMGK